EAVADLLEPYVHNRDIGQRDHVVAAIAADLVVPLDHERAVVLRRERDNTVHVVAGPGGIEVRGSAGSYDGAVNVVPGRRDRHLNHGRQVRIDRVFGDDAEAERTREPGCRRDFVDVYIEAVAVAVQRVGGQDVRVGAREEPRRLEHRQRELRGVVFVQRIEEGLIAECGADIGGQRYPATGRDQHYEQNKGGREEK